MRVLREGMSGMDVMSWQNFLLGQYCYQGIADGQFGPKTKEATMVFQAAQALDADGIVGTQTYAKAIGMGLDVVVDTAREVNGPNWPPRPTNLRPIVSNEEKKKVFGAFDYEPAPIPGNPEAIRIIGNWVTENIEFFEVPQLNHLSGISKGAKIFFHKVGAEQFLNLWTAWEQSGLLHHVVSWDGSWVPRFIRGSRTVLSNHAWGTAFDINAMWNPLGATPALVGQRGSLRDLVALANEHGFYWGGHFSGRPDGMHFELARKT